MSSVNWTVTIDRLQQNGLVRQQKELIKKYEQTAYLNWYQRKRVTNEIVEIVKKALRSRQLDEDVES